MSHITLVWVSSDYVLILLWFYCIHWLFGCLTDPLHPFYSLSCLKKTKSQPFAFLVWQSTASLITGSSGDLSPSVRRRYLLGMYLMNLLTLINKYHKIARMYSVLHCTRCYWDQYLVSSTRVHGKQAGPNGKDLYSHILGRLRLDNEDSSAPWIT